MGAKLNERNTSQGHGLEFENLMKVSRMFSGAANIARTGQESFDIEADCDEAFGLATSVKTAKGDWIGLADAERFCRIDRPWRLLYAPWEQETPRLKVYEIIHELIVPLGVMRRIVGEVTPELALAWHNDIAQFAPGRAGAVAARARRDEIKREMEGRTGLLRLDFKIDDRKQRRLQFSIRFSEMGALLVGLPEYRARGRSQPLHVVHRDEFHQYPLPIRLLSDPRRIERMAERTGDTGVILFDDAPVVSLAGALLPMEDEADATILRRPPPVRREERAKRRMAAADIRQITLFG